ncbi:MAG: hypothetical protein ACXVDV_20050 [Bacteroidia bacterium]
MYNELNIDLKNETNENIENAYIYLYCTIEDNEYFKEKNIIIKSILCGYKHLLTVELGIRDINIAKLINRANAIIQINRSLANELQRK